jgi:adenylate cyclase
MSAARVRDALASVFHWRGRTLALICLIGFLVFRVLEPVPFETLRTSLFDALHVMKPRARQELPVIIVDIDEKSLAKYGQWPWPRNLMARLVDRIGEARPLAVGFDILFSEQDRYSPHHVLKNFPYLDPELIRELGTLPSNDTLLAESLAKIPSVLGVGALFSEERTINTRPVKIIPFVERGGSANPHLLHFPTALQSIPELDNAAKSRATLNVIPEFDGVVRRVPLVIDIGGTATPTLTLEMLRLAVGASHFAIHSDEHGIRGIAVDDVFVPTEPDGRIWVNFSEPDGNLYVSAADILDDSPRAALLAGKLVLLGSTGLGLTDTKATPVTAQMNGIEVHAHVLESIISGEHLIRPIYANWLELSFAFVTGLLLILIVPSLGSKWATAPLVIVLVLLAIVAWLAHAEFALRIDTSFAGASNTAIFAILLVASLIESDRIRRLLQRDLELERAAAERLEGELAAARSIQLGILPSTFPAFPEHKEFDLHALLEPAKAVGGDLYDFEMLDDHHLFFIVGDVSGKGIPASLFMALTKALYKSSAMRRQIAIEGIMTEANAEISRENPAMMFVTALSGILDIRTGLVQFCNAGHDPPFSLSPGQPVTTIPNDGGPPLCVLDDFEYPRDTYQMKPGEAIVLFTDGVTEAMTDDKELYTASRLETFLSKQPDDLDCAGIVERIFEDVKKFADGAEQSDDVTLLVLRYFGTSEAQSD